MAIFGFFYNIVHPDMDNALDLEVTKFAANNKQSIRVVTSTIYSRSLPLAVSSTFAALIFAPSALEITFNLSDFLLSNHTVAELRYDAVATCLCFVVVIMIAIASFSWMKLFKLYEKRTALRRTC